MTASRPEIVVTLPARTIVEARGSVATARDAGADAAELRADRLAPGELDRVSEIFPSALPLVGTYRSRAEGGEGADTPEARRPILTALSRLPFRWLDLELVRDLPLLPEIPPADRLGRIVSHHLGSDEAKQWAGELGRLEAVDGVGKLVFPCSVGLAFSDVLPRLRQRDAEVIVHTTGASGPVLRALSRRLGFPLVYAALPEAAGEPPVEPSQIPVDRLRPYLEADEPPPLFAVVGRPIGHSRSPALHSAWMHDDGELGLYLALEIEDDREFVETLPFLAESGFRGLNVTHPFKAVASAAASDLGPGARACGAANCLTFRDGTVVAENTDLLAILRRLDELRRSHRWDGRELTVLGSGGAARATLAAARELGADATVVARRPEAGREVAERFGARAVAAREAKRSALVVHATPVGRGPAAEIDLPLPALLTEGGHLLDWVYAPQSPTVRDAAAAAGATYEDGGRLLIYQAAASYELWWDHPPPESAVARSIEAAG